MKLALKIIVCVLLMELLGGAMGALTAGSTGPGSWYDGLNKPPGTPPNFVFGIVWSVLYALMGISLALVWHFHGFKDRRGRRALGFFLFQLMFNLLWTPLFFNMHWMAAAFVDIVLLWFAVDAAIFIFSRVHKPAAWLLVPYWLWVTYAAYLNAGYLQLN